MKAIVTALARKAAQFSRILSFHLTGIFITKWNIWMLLFVHMNAEIIGQSLSQHPPGMFHFISPRTSSDILLCHNGISRSHQFINAFTVIFHFSILTASTPFCYKNISEWRCTRHPKQYLQRSLLTTPYI